MENILNIFESLIKPTSVLIALIIILFLNSWIFEKIKSININTEIIKNSISIFVMLIATVIFIFSLPIENALKGHILSFIAVILSAGIALSSTTLLGNIIAGIMNNSIARFKNGDLIKIDDIFGKVTKKGILQTEIQLEDHNFITLPNLYIATRPMKLIRKNDSVISTIISLGYDIPHPKVEILLKEAAIKSNLTEPYVYIKELGDFSILYQINGFLKDSYRYFSSVSNLNKNVIDVLHENKIEIVSPNFINIREVGKTVFIPKISKEPPIIKNDITPEDLVFDEAIKSEIIEEKKEYIKKLKRKEEELYEKKKELKNKENIEKINQSIKKIKKLETNIENSINSENNKN